MEYDKSYQTKKHNFGTVCKIDKRNDLSEFGYQYRVVLKKKFFNVFENSCMLILGDGASKCRYAWRHIDELRPAYVNYQWCKFVDKQTIYFKEYNHIEQVLMYNALTVR